MERVASWTIVLTQVLFVLSSDYVVAYGIFDFDRRIISYAPHPMPFRAGSRPVILHPHFNQLRPQKNVFQIRPYLNLLPLKKYFTTLSSPVKGNRESSTSNYLHAKHLNQIVTKDLFDSVLVKPDECVNCKNKNSYSDINVNKDLSHTGLSATPDNTVAATNLAKYFNKSSKVSPHETKFGKNKQKLSEELKNNITNYVGPFAILPNATETIDIRLKTDTANDFKYEDVMETKGSDRVDSFNTVTTQDENILQSTTTVRTTENLTNEWNHTIADRKKNDETVSVKPASQNVLDKQRTKELIVIFSDALDKLDRNIYTTTFNKLRQISPEERRENGISFAQSGLFLSLLLMALSTETDDETRAEIDQCLQLNFTKTEKTEVIKYMLSTLPPSNVDLKFRWATRLVLGPAQYVSDWFEREAATALQMNLERTFGNETDEELANNLNRMITDDSGGVIRDTFDADELTGGVRAAALTTLYLRGRWRSAPTVLNGTRLFHDAGGAPKRTMRMIRINDLMRYAKLDDCHFEALEISYSTAGLTLLMLIPDDGLLQPLARHLAASDLSGITQRMAALRVAATMPLYTLRMTLLLPSKLQAMGINKLMKADNATDDGTLKLSHAVQRLMFWSEAGRHAFKDDGIEWDEPPELELVVDRPYLFFVRWHNITLMSGNFVL